ncbi:hypothetical protein FZEAL_8201 [Fusarium zealandicum]|uniref:Uncharacterized protein n=1 Tax=Fusarium zealandicum TaxID=1053134 RepID=A0A8H4UE92_9HYPO|nr:hypothetical protein FZEAL_8201 [Fusarium zealandicum]
MSRRTNSHARHRGQDGTLKFIVETPSTGSSRENQKAIKSHVSQSKLGRKRQSQVKSWILKRQDKIVAATIQHGSIPGRVGSDLSLLDFPEPLKPYMEHDIIRSFYGMKGALYPAEICLQADPMQSSWTTNLLSDLVYFHSTIFSIEAYFDDYLGREPGALDLASISDATIMVVVVLGLTAELIGDRAAAENHIAGMAKIVNLRGGLEMIRFDNPRLPAKVCRVDVGLALRFGCKPVFFRESISWDLYVASQGLIRGLGKGTKPEREDEVSKFAKTLDERLTNVWKDLQEFSRLGNLAHQTTYKLQPNTFSEIMVSILYRLLALSFPESPIEDALRLGMMTYAASIFFRWRGMNQRQGWLDGSFQEALLKLKSNPTQPPLAILLWLLTVWNISASEQVCDDTLSPWTFDIVSRGGFGCWTEANTALRSVMWISCIFDMSGRQILDAALAKTDT